MRAKLFRVRGLLDGLKTFFNLCNLALVFFLVDPLLF